MPPRKSPRSRKSIKKSIKLKRSVVKRRSPKVKRSVVKRRSPKVKRSVVKRRFPKVKRLSYKMEHPFSLLSNLVDVIAYQMRQLGRGNPIKKFFFQNGDFLTIILYGRDVYDTTMNFEKMRIGFGFSCDEFLQLNNSYSIEEDRLDRDRKNGYLLLKYKITDHEGFHDCLLKYYTTSSVEQIKIDRDIYQPVENAMFAEASRRAEEMSRRVESVQKGIKRGQESGSLGSIILATTPNFEGQIAKRRADELEKQRSGSRSLLDKMLGRNIQSVSGGSSDQELFLYPIDYVPETFSEYGAAHLPSLGYVNYNRDEEIGGGSVFSRGSSSRSRHDSDEIMEDSPKSGKEGKKPAKNRK